MVVPIIDPMWTTRSMRRQHRSKEQLGRHQARRRAQQIQHFYERLVDGGGMSRRQLQSIDVAVQQPDAWSPTSPFGCWVAEIFTGRE
jgi:hypothetical protein